MSFNTQNAVKNYFELLVSENVSEKEVRVLKIANNKLNIITTKGKLIKTTYGKKD